FLRRLRTSLAKGDRSFLCPSSGAPLIVVSHFPFHTSARARSRLHHSRSSIGSTERLQNATGDSVEELRPFDFSEVEVCVHFEQLGCKLRRSSLAAGGVAWKSPSKDDRRASDLRQSTTLSLASVGTVTARESTESRGDLTAEEDSYKLAAENRRQSDYDPKILDEILQIIGLPHLSLVKGVSKTYASAQAIKATLNETFANKYPNIHITYSKLRSIKRDILLIAKECDIDEYAVAHAFVYFERIIFKGLISKYNRKLVAGVALLVAVKLNDYKKPDIVKCAEEKLRISRREMLSFELPLCSALQFDLFPPAHHLEPHLRKIIVMSNFEQFYQDIKATEKEDSTLTSSQQLDRLLRPGSTYLNLNPFEVLQIDPDADIELAKKKFKKLSLLIHPDKNPDDRDRADQAFDIIKKAMKQIENPLELNRCKDCYTEARARLAIVMSEKRRKVKKEKGTSEIEEDDPAVYKKQLWITVTKVFADREKKRKMLEERANEEKRRTAETIQQAAEKRKLAEEFAKNYEESRDERSGSWRNFQAKKAKREEGGKTMRGAAFRPPKPKLQK
ncbi:cyclin domain protein, partial [Cooperia oncophora]